MIILLYRLANRSIYKIIVGLDCRKEVIMSNVN